jgi:hypothetical protein
MRRFPHPELQLRKRLALHASQRLLRTVHICMGAPALKKHIKLECSIEELLNGK